MNVQMEEWQAKALRNYFDINGKTTLEHWAYAVFNNALNQPDNSKHPNSESVSDEKINVWAESYKETLVESKGVYDVDYFDIKEAVKYGCKRMRSKLEPKEKEDFELQRLYDWLQEENREPAQTKFTSGMTRNVAREVEYLIKHSR